MTGEHRSYSRGVCHFDPTAPEHLREVNARSRHDLAMCWSAPSESKRGPRQRRSALGDLAQLDADDRERASCKSAQAHSEGAGNPRPSRCGGGAAHVRAWRGQYEPRGCPRGGRSWCFAGLPLGDLRRKADPGRLAVALLAAVQGGTLLAQLRRGPSHLETALDEVLDRIEDLRRRRAQLRQ